MPNRDEIELALTAVLSHLHESGEDLHNFVEVVISKVYVQPEYKEYSHPNKAAVVEELHQLAEKLAGPRPQQPATGETIEEF